MGVEIIKYACHVKLFCNSILLYVCFVEHMFLLVFNMQNPRLCQNLYISHLLWIITSIVISLWVSFQGCVTSVPKHSIDVVPIQIVCHKTSDANDFNDDNVFKCLWRNAQQVIESTKSCPPCAIKYQHNFCVFIREVLRNSSHLLTDDEKNFIGMFLNARVVIFVLVPF